MKIGLLTFEQHLGKKDVGSSRIRGHWVIQKWNEAGPDIGSIELFKFGEYYDVVIYQKAYFVEHARAFKGVKILDLCDPDWLHWSYKTKEMIEEVDVITCSSEALVDSVKSFTDKPVYFIPDRVQLDAFPEPKTHKGETKSVVWFGYSHNFPMLDAAIQSIVKRNLSLIVVSDGVYAPPAAFKVEMVNYPWSPHYMRDIQSGDIVINPRYHKGKWKFKSDNKTTIGKALGMPVAHDGDELSRLMTGEARQKASEEGLKEVKEKFDVKYSVEEYKKIIMDISKQKNGK